MEIATDLSSIHDEDLLRKMWQQAEDFGRKKEIRSHLYKLREARLREFYSPDDMESTKSFSKSPMTPSHGESLLDQSFQSFKTKEIRDSESPTRELKFRSGGGVVPDTSGWNIQTTSEVSPDGRSRKIETLATTEGVQKLTDGHSEFAGRNEEKSSSSHYGDDKNYIKSAADSSSSHLHEKVVTGDGSSERIETKSSKVTSSSSQEVFSSSTSSGHQLDALKNNSHSNSKLSDAIRKQQEDMSQKRQESFQENRQESRKKITSETSRRESEIREDLRQQEQLTSRKESKVREDVRQKEHLDESTRLAKTREMQKQDKSSPEYQQYVNYLSSQNGKILSETVESPKPNVKLITTRKQLEDGTIVTTRRYETQNQESNSTQSETQRKKVEHHRSDSERSFSKTLDNKATQISRDSLKQDDVDRSDINIQYLNDQSEVFKTNKTVKKDLSQTIRNDKLKNREFIDSERASDNVSNTKKEQNQNVRDEYIRMTHGEPHPIRQESVHQSERRVSSIQSEHFENYDERSTSSREVRTSSQDYSTHGFPSVRKEIPTNKHTSDRPTADFTTTHGFPSARSETPQSQRPSEDYGAPSRKPERPGHDFTTHGFPSVGAPSLQNPQHLDNTRRPSAEKSPDFRGTQGFPSVRPTSDSPQRQNAKPMSAKNTSEPQKRPEDFRGTHGFPSVKDDVEVDIHQHHKEETYSSYRSDDASSVTTDRRGSTDSIRHDRKLDAAHNAFASSLRCASPVDNRSPSRSQRTSISSVRSTYSPAKRDMRSPSCDSETSRFSSSTVNKRMSTTSKSSMSKKDLFQSNETVDLDETTLKRRGTNSKIGPSPDTKRGPSARQGPAPKTPQRETAKTPARRPSESSPGEPSRRTQYPKQNLDPNRSEELLTKKKIISDVEAVHGDQVIEEPVVKRDYYKLGKSVATNSGFSNHPPDDKAPRDQRQRSPSPRHEPIGINFVDNLDQRPKSPSLASSLKTTTKTSHPTQNKHNIQSPSKPHTIRGPTPKDQPEGYVSKKTSTYITEKDYRTTTKDVSYPDYLSVPKVGRSPQTSPEHSTATPTRVPTNTNNNAPKPTKKTDSPSCSRPTTTNKTSTSTKFTKTIKVDNAILRDQNEPSNLRPNSDDEGYEPDESAPTGPKPDNTSDDEGFDQNTPKCASPYGLKKVPTTDLDVDDVLIEIHENIVDSTTTVNKKDRLTYNREDIETRKNVCEPEHIEPSAPEYVRQASSTEDITETQGPMEARSPVRNYSTTKTTTAKEETETSDTNRRSRPRGPSSPEKDYPSTRKATTFDEDVETTETDNQTRPNIPSSTDMKSSSTRKTTKVDEDIEVTKTSRQTRPRGSLSPEREHLPTMKTTYVDKNIEITATQQRTHPKGKPSPRSFTSTSTVEEDIETEMDFPSSRKTTAVGEDTKITESSINTTMVKEDNDITEINRRPLSPVRDYSSTSTTMVNDGTDIKEINTKSSKIISSHTEDETHTPFFLNEFSPENDNTQKPKVKPTLSRSETYEDRCRQILGMNRSENVEEIESLVQTEIITKRSPSPEKANPLSEGYKPKTSPERPRSVSPKKTSTPYQEFIDKEKHVESFNRSHTQVKTNENEITTYDSESSRSHMGRSKAPTRETSPVTKSLTPRSPTQSPIRNNVPDVDFQSPAHRHPVPTQKTSTTPTTVKTVSSKIPAERPNHVTTARMQITPPSSPLSPSTKSKPTGKYLSTTVTREITPKSPTKPTSSPSSLSRKPKDTVPASPVTKRTLSDRKTPRVESEIESDLVTDTDSVVSDVTITTTISKTTHKTTPTRKIPITERKESAPVFRTTKTDRDIQKMARSTSENVIKTNITKRIKPELEPKSLRKNSAAKISPKSERRPSKCLTTKTINLTTVDRILNSEDMENVVIDIQQAKSSREPSPNKIVPTPVPLNLDTGRPRYPDVVHEPDDEPKKKSHVKNIPIFEEETNGFVSCHITEVKEDVSEKSKTVSKQVSTQQIRNIPKIVSPEETDTHSHVPTDDECLLSVHDKVSKFTTSAEDEKKPKTSAPFQRDLPESGISEDECLLSVDEKVNKFLETADKVTNEVKTSSSKPIGRPRIEDLDEDIKADECVLSVSEKVNKFIDKAEKLAPTTPQRSPELVAKIERQISRQSDDLRDDLEIVTKTLLKSSVTEKFIPEKPKDTSPKKTSESRKTSSAPKQRDILSRPSVWEKKRETDVTLEDIGIQKNVDELEESVKMTENRNRSKSREHEVIDVTKKITTKPVRIPSSTSDSVSSRKNLFERKVSTDANKTLGKSSHTYSGPKSSGIKPSSKLPKEHSPSRLVSETTSTTTTTKRVESKYPLEEDEDTPSRRRPSATSPTHSNSSYLEEYSSYKRSTSRQQDVTSTQPKRGQESVSARRNIFEQGDVSPKPTGTKPSYMEHTKSSLEHRRDSIEVTKTNYNRKSSVEEEPYEGNPRSTVKFGVDLKHKEEPQPRRKSSCPEIPHVEDIFDLPLLEEMLNTVTSYDQRRRIRAQIRVVKKMLETKKEQTVRKTTDSPDMGRTRTPVGSLQKDKIRSNSTQKFIETETSHIREHEEKVERDRSVSPQSKVRTIITTVTEVRKTGGEAPSKIGQPIDEKPIWAQKNILKKASENGKNTRSSSLKKSTATTTRTQTQTQRQKILTDEDCITSSYGIGPTDDDGRPLFGIRALKKKSSQPSETTKVTGTVVTEKYYSENGAVPVGERKVTVYSTNADELDELESQYDRRGSETIKREKSSTDGLTSITKVQKIGKESNGDIPSLTHTRRNSSKQSSKVVRRGSVKEISEKFIRKESSSSVTEKTSSSSYPKAGLILRTRTHSRGDTPDRYSARSGSAEYEDESEQEECDIEIRSSRKHSKVVTESESEAESMKVHRTTKSTKSFLNSSGAKVTGVDDVLDRMRNADNIVEDGDSVEDQEARALLNKFLGASVLMTGVEAMVPNEAKKSTATDNNLRKEIKSTRVTKTIKTGNANSSSPVVRKTCAIEEIWDEETLRQLLEQSTNYEERREIRARLKQLMAEREACAEIVASVKAELDESETVVAEDKIVVVEEDASSESEYEEIIEEVTVTDYSDDEDDVVEKSESKVEGESEEKEEEITVVVDEVEQKEQISAVVTSVIVVEEEIIEEVERTETESAISDTEEKIANPVEAPVVEAPQQEQVTNEEEPIQGTSSVEALSSTTTEKTETKEEDGAVVTTTTKVTTRTISSAPKPVSAFAKFKQLDKQNSLQSPKSPLTPTTPGGTSTASYFKFTDPALNARAATVKEQLLQWCQSKTKEYENVQITNFSTCWTDGLAFCALIHHFLPDSFDYSKLTPQQRRYNFELAFRVADEKAGIAPLLDVEDMVVMKRPDWKCVFTYVQSIFRRFRNCQ